MITRRYYRSGESEYYINKQRARLQATSTSCSWTPVLAERAIPTSARAASTRSLPSNRPTAARSSRRPPASPNSATARRIPSAVWPTPRITCLRIGDKISELELQVGPLREQAEKAQEISDAPRRAPWARGHGLARKPQEDRRDRARKAETDYASAAFILEQAHDELTTLYSRSEQLSLQYNQQTLQLDHQRETIGQLETARQQTQNDITLLQSEIAAPPHTTSPACSRSCRTSRRRSGGIAGQIAAEQEKIAANDQAAFARPNRLSTQAQTQADALSGEAAAAGQKLTALHAQQALLQTQERLHPGADRLHGGFHGRGAGPAKPSSKEDLTAARARRAQIADQQSACKKQPCPGAGGRAEPRKTRIAGYELPAQDPAGASATPCRSRRAPPASSSIPSTPRSACCRRWSATMRAFPRPSASSCRTRAPERLRGVHGPVSKLHPRRRPLYHRHRDRARRGHAEYRCRLRGRRQGRHPDAQAPRRRPRDLPAPHHHPAPDAAGYRLPAPAGLHRHRLQSRFLRRAVPRRRGKRRSAAPSSATRSTTPCPWPARAAAACASSRSTGRS